MENVILYLVPLCITLYLYLLPKVLVNISVKKYIDREFIDYIDNDISKFNFLKERIYRLTDFLSFIGATSGIFISVISDDDFLWNKTFTIATIMFLLVTIYFIIQYGFNSLKLSGKQKVFEFIFIGLSLLMLLYNVFLRN